MAELYHYTDLNSVRSIQREGCIRPSHDASGRGHRGPGGRHGAGVYLTDMNPKEHDQREIAQNNYRAGWEKNIGKTDHFIQVEISHQERRLLEKIDGRIWVFRGEIGQHMFRSSGANKNWDPHATAVVAIVGGLAVGASLYSAYREQKCKDDMKKVKEEEERRMAEARRALEVKGDIAPSFWRDLKEEPKPSDFVASCRDIGADIDGHLANWIWIIRNVIVGSLVLAASGGLANICNIAIPLAGAAAMGLCSVNLCGDFDPSSRLRNVLGDENFSLFLQKEDNKESSWLGRVVSWMVGSSSVANLDYSMSISKKGFGLITVATVSLPLAASPSTERKYYWIGVLGRWYAVTVYHYKIRNNES